MTATVDSSGSAAPRARAQTTNGHGAPFSHTLSQSAPAQSAIGIPASPPIHPITTDHVNSGLFVNARREAASLATPALVLKVAPLILKQARDRARLHDLIMSAIKLALEGVGDVDYPALLENIRTLQEQAADDGNDLHGAVEVLMERALAQPAGTDLPTRAVNAPFTPDVEAADTKNPSQQASDQTDQQVKDSLKLRNTVEFMDCLSQDGFSKISSIARLALASLETPDGHRSVDGIADALTAIWGLAENHQDCISSEAESVGCNYVDTAQERRRKARADAAASAQAQRVAA